LQSILLNDILDLTTSDNGRLSIHKEPVDLHAVIVAALAVVECAAKDKGIGLDLELKPRSAFVLGDALRLQRVIWNLLTNAVKFTPNGGRIRVELQADGSTVRLSISDTGCGINPAFLPRIFEQFERDPVAGDRNCPGAGLGLAIVRRVVELHGGRVEAESYGQGQGATFTVLLPQLDPRSTDGEDHNNDSIPVEEGDMDRTALG
jgi:signal transduction histidine kinase